MPEGPPAEIMALIDAVLSGFNSKNATLYKSAFGDNVVIIDGFAPFRWVGPNAPTQWWADAETWAKAADLESEHISSEGILYWEVRGTRAYAVVSAILTIKLKKGAPITRSGTLTFTFGKIGEVWKAEGHAWARMS